MAVGPIALSAVLAFHELWASAAEPAIPSGVALASWQNNGQGGRHLLQLAQGQSLPMGKSVVGTVTSDTDCQADAQGLSHCRNEIALADGGRLVVIDTHAMMRNRCLAPGDRLSLSATAPGWLLGTLQ